jgi:hypothetical protein
MPRPKHTPGPWKSTAEEQQHDLGENFYILGGPDYACHIAEMLNADHFPCIPDDEVEDYEIEVEGNARLIAAAPDLLAALNALVEAVRLATGEEDAGLHHLDGSLIDAARKAIRKTEPAPRKEVESAQT